MKASRGLCVGALVVLLPLSGLAGSYPQSVCGAYPDPGDPHEGQGFHRPFERFAERVEPPAHGDGLRGGDAFVDDRRRQGPCDDWDPYGAGGTPVGWGRNSPRDDWDAYDRQRGPYPARRPASYAPQGSGRYGGSDPYAGGYDRDRTGVYPSPGQPRADEYPPGPWGDSGMDPESAYADGYRRDWGRQRDALPMRDPMRDPMREEQTWDHGGRSLRGPTPGYRFRGDDLAEARSAKGRVRHAGFEFRPLTDQEQQRMGVDMGWRRDREAVMGQPDPIDWPPAEEAYGYHPDSWFHRYYGIDR